MRKKILFLQYTNGESCRKMLKGAQRYANIRNRWEFSAIANCKSVPSIKALLKFWKPDGCIADCGGIGRAFRPKDFGTIPLVMLNRSADETNDDIPSVFHNQRESAQLAIKEILRLSRNGLAFVSWITNTKWSQMRESEFVEAMRMHGCTPLSFHAWRIGKEETHEVQKELRNFLGRLPLPGAVFAANDRMAREVIAAAHAINLSVPDDIAVVGMDNNEMIALSGSPSLTTVEIDFEEAGFTAAELLDNVLSNPSARHVKRFFGPLRLIRRGSTIIAQRKDQIVDDAREYIRRHCADGISSRDVAALFPCSRRMAEVRFRAATGHAIGEEILDARMDLVKGYLSSSTINIDAIANLSGWKSSAVLRQYFKRKTGMSLSAWRNSQRQ
jgi:LacI family transcriptional regulator